MESDSAAVDAYCQGFPAVPAARLAELVALLRAAAPLSREALKWNAPAFIHPQGTILFMASGHRQHMSVVFTPSTKEAFNNRLEGIQTGKGTVKLPFDEPLPTELLTDMVRYRIWEYEAHAIKWI